MADTEELEKLREKMNELIGDENERPEDAENIKGLKKAFSDLRSSNERVRDESTVLMRDFMKKGRGILRRRVYFDFYLPPVIGVYALAVLLIRLLFPS